MKRVFDADYSVDSPSKKYLNETGISKNNENMNDDIASEYGATGTLPLASAKNQEINFEFLERS